MSASMFARVAGVAMMLVVAAACGSDADTDEPAAAVEPENTSTTTTTADVASEPTPTTTAPSTTVPSTTVPSTTSPAPVELLPSIATEPTDPGPRPLLAWTPLEQARRYTVVVLGSDGLPYWAWAGSASSIPMGGIGDPDLVGPWVHESMTWTVAAFDQDGVAIGLSEPAPLIP